MAIPIRNTTGWVIGAQMISASTGVAYGGTVTVYVTGDAGTQVLGGYNGGLAIAEGNGYYTYRPLQTETDFTYVGFTFVGSGAIPTTIQVPTETATQAAAVIGTTTTLAYTVRSIITDALQEIGVLAAEETLTAAQGQIGLRRVQQMIDAWAADQLTLSRQLRTVFNWPSNVSAVQVGSGQTVDMVRPVWVSEITYVNPGTTPGVEVPLGLMDEDAYASISIKGLQSGLPMQAFYQTNLADANGTLTIWPVPTQGLTMVLYTPQAVGVPATLDSVLLGPEGYQSAFLYQLALRLCMPFGVAVPDLLPRMAATAFDAMKRPNVEPGVMGIDAALVPGLGGGYNILTDSTTFSR
jgi:hypothetical protein